MRAESVGGCASSVHQRGVFSGLVKEIFNYLVQKQPSKISQEDGSSSSNPRQGSWKSDVDKVWREHFL